MGEPVAWLAFATDASESRAVFVSREEAEEMCRKCGWEMAPLWPQGHKAGEDGAKAELLAYSSLPIDDNYRCSFRLERREGGHPPNELVRGFLKAADAFATSMREELAFRRNQERPIRNDYHQSIEEN